jgi:hypothetical protein
MRDLEIAGMMNEDDFMNGSFDQVALKQSP